MIVNIARAMVPRKKGATPPKMTAPKDYMPVWYDNNAPKIQIKKQSVETMKNILLGWVKNKKGERRKVKKPVINKKTGKKRMV